jgi:hypothetical protein
MFWEKQLGCFSRWYQELMIQRIANIQSGPKYICPLQKGVRDLLLKAKVSMHTHTHTHTQIILRKCLTWSVGVISLHSWPPQLLHSSFMNRRANTYGSLSIHPKVWPIPSPKWCCHYWISDLLITGKDWALTLTLLKEINLLTWLALSTLEGAMFYPIC